MLDFFGTDLEKRKDPCLNVWIKMLNELKIVLSKPFFSPLYCTLILFFEICIIMLM